MSYISARNASLEPLHPVFRNAVRAVIAQLEDEGLPFRIYEAYRSPDRQHYLYQQGRSRAGAIVTKAKPWTSFHQYGLAADFVLYINGQWSWRTDGQYARAWDRLHEIGRAHGLKPLGFEKPHLQIAHVDVADLRGGHYPAGGDDSWASNLEAAIVGWRGDPAAPPAPEGGGRPPLPSDEGAISPATNTISRPNDQALFEKCQEFVREYEGGFVNDPHDAGGATNFGITIATLERARGHAVTVADVRNMTYDEAKQIYKRLYWVPIRCGEMPAGVALAVYNIGVHCGTGTAARYLQRALNAVGANLAVDGDVGSKTITALRATRNVPALANELIDLYEARLRGNPNFGYFGAGFMRRVSALRHAVSTLVSQTPSSEIITMPQSPFPSQGAQPRDLDIHALLQQLVSISSVLVSTRDAGGGIRFDPNDPAQTAKLREIFGAASNIHKELSGKDLGPVNGALGETVGNLLDGRKTAIGLVGAVAAQLAQAAPAGSTIAKAAEFVPFLTGMSPVAMPIFLGLTAWGILGKMEKWAEHSKTATTE